MKRLLAFLLPASAPHAAPNLILAKEYGGQNVAGWAMSEKLDGVRAYWDGRRLLSRQGHAFAPPPGFVRDFPPFPLDGELYSRRGAFEQISAAVRSANGNWNGIKLHIFDAPQASGNLYQRLALVERHLAARPRTNITVIRQTPVRDIEHARQFLYQIEAHGGEGVMLRNPAPPPYQDGRSSNLLKFKSAHDAECTVTAHHPGKGRNAGLLGAVSCRNELGEPHRFRLQRHRPPQPSVRRQPHHLQIPRFYRQRHSPLRHLSAPHQLSRPRPVPTQKAT